MTTDSDLIRAAASKWLRDHEVFAISRLRYQNVGSETQADTLKRLTEWSDWQVNNMVTYLAMVDET